MKKFLILFLFSVFLCSCCVYDPGVAGIDYPHRYYDTVEVQVVDIDKTTWFATNRKWKVEYEVYCEKYNISKTFSDFDTGMFQPSSWGYEKGDVITMKVYFLKYDNSDILYNVDLVR